MSGQRDRDAGERLTLVDSGSRIDGVELDRLATALARALATVWRAKTAADRSATQREEEKPNAPTEVKSVEALCEEEHSCEATPRVRTVHVPDSIASTFKRG